MTYGNFEAGLGKQDIRVLAAYPKIHEIVDGQVRAGFTTPQIASNLNSRFGTDVFNEKWAESIKRRVDTARQVAEKK